MMQPATNPFVVCGGDLYGLSAAVTTLEGGAKFG